MATCSNRLTLTTLYSGFNLIDPAVPVAGFRGPVSAECIMSTDWWVSPAGWRRTVDLRGCPWVGRARGSGSSQRLPVSLVVSQEVQPCRPKTPSGLRGIRMFGSLLETDTNLLQRTLSSAGLVFSMPLFRWLPSGARERRTARETLESHASFDKG